MRLKLLLISEKTHIIKRYVLREHLKVTRVTKWYWSILYGVCNFSCLDFVFINAYHAFTINKRFWSALFFFPISWSDINKASCLCLEFIFLHFFSSYAKTKLLDMRSCFPLILHFWGHKAFYQFKIIECKNRNI